MRHLVRRQALYPEMLPVEVEHWPWPVRIYTLGKFELYLDENPVRFQGKTQKKPLQMLKGIISLGGKNVKNERLMDLLWPEAEGDKAMSAFTSTLSRLRSLIGNDKAVLVHEGKVSLNPRCCWVDAWGFEKLADRLGTRFKERRDPIHSGDGEDDASLAEKAISMYAGTFLSGESGQQWILPFREHLMYRFCRLVSGYGKHLERSEKWDQAAECYRKALVFDDLVDEEIYQKLMALYWRNGQSDRAIEVYMRLCRTLSAVLGIKPSPGTEAIYNSLIRHSDPKPPDAVS